MGERAIWREGVCGGMRLGGGRLCKAEIMAEVVFVGGSFCPDCLSQMSAVRGTLISVNVQKFSQIGQSADDL